MVKKLNAFWDYFKKTLEITPSRMTRRKKMLWLWGLYTALFSIIFLWGFRAFLVNDRSFIEGGDGLMQHILLLQYFGEYWRELIRNFFAGNFAVPMFDFRIGMGNDIVQSMTTYAFGDIFNLLTVFVPARHVEFYYNALVIIRMYLSGITLALFCIHMKQKKWAVLAGSLIYAFCGFALVFTPNASMFAIPMIYTPLILLGLDRILQKKSPFLFIITVFLQALTGFYFLYMITIFVFVYAIIRLHHLYGKDFFRTLPSSFLKTAGSYLLGVAMAAVFLLPMILAFLTGFRSGHYNMDGLFFGSYISTHMFLNSVAPAHLFLPTSYLSMAAIAIVSVVALIAGKRINKNDKWHMTAMFLFCLVLYALPFGGWMMNGFGFVTGRFIFLFSIVLSFITVYMLPRMNKVGRRGFAACVGLILLYGYFPVFSETHRSFNNFLGLSMLLASAAIIAVGVALARGKNGNKLAGFIALPMILLIVLNTGVNTHYIYSSDLGGGVNTFMINGQARNEYRVQPALPPSVREQDNEFFRAEKNTLTLPNSPLARNYNGVSQFLSIMNSAYGEGLFDLELFSQIFAARVNGLDNRTVLNAISSTKYNLVKFNTDSFPPDSSYYPLPFGFELYDTTQHTVRWLSSEGNPPQTVEQRRRMTQKTYINRYALPLGYTYERALSRSDYYSMSALQRQEAMIQAVFLDDAHANADVSDIQFDTARIPHTIIEKNGLTWENGVLHATEENASITFGFEGLKNSETYLRIENFSHDTRAAAHISVRSGGVTKGGMISFPSFAYYFGRENFLINLGFSEQAREQITFTIAQPGVYTLEDFGIYCFPLDNFPGAINALREEALENIRVETNRVSGDISLSGDKFLVLSIPYSEGWSARVNGESAELLQANTMFMALPLQAGEHTIELTYRTPGIVAGAALSAAGVTIFAVLVIFLKRRKKKSANKQEEHSILK